MSNRQSERFASLREYIEAKGVKKNRVALGLGIRPQRLSELLLADVYAPTVDDELCQKIASLLNQPISYVRKLYPRAA